MSEGATAEDLVAEDLVAEDALGANAVAEDVVGQVAAGADAVVTEDDALLARAARVFADARAAGRERAVLAICGAPGAGKTTLARMLVSELPRLGVPVAWLPLDGFHLGDDALRVLGRLERKGAIDTFDGWGYVATVRRVLEEADHEIFVSGFERDLEQPIAANLIVPAGPALVVTEGNWLLDASEPWAELADLFAETWLVETDDIVRRERLVARHVQFGKSGPEARAWVERVDEPNAVRVAAARERASLVVAL